MADAVESASRTLSDPTPSRLEGLVSELIDKRLRDGQFDQCDLTLREIAAHPREPDQVADRHLPRPGQVPRAADGLTRWPRHPSRIRRRRDRPERHPGPPPARPRRRPLDRPARPGRPRGSTRASLSIAVVDDAAIRAVNRRHLDHDWPTDVISFPLLRARRRRTLAASWSSRPRWRPRSPPSVASTRRREFALYLVHGLLHLCGYDDQTDAERRPDAAPRGRDPLVAAASRAAPDRSRRTRTSPGRMILSA